MESTPDLPVEAAQLALMQSVWSIWRARVLKRRSVPSPWTLKRQVWAAAVTTMRAETLKPHQESVFGAKLYNKDDFDTVCVLGEGFYGHVKLCRHRRSDAQYAVKEFKEDVGPGAVSEEARLLFLKEMGLHTRLFHPNILEFKGVYWADGRPCLVTEYISGGNLLSCLLSANPLDWQRRINFALDISAGMAYLHDQGVLHRDLKSENVLLRHDFKAVVCDFGLSRQMVLQRHRATKPSILARMSDVLAELASTGQESLRIIPSIRVYKRPVVIVDPRTDSAESATTLLPRSPRLCRASLESHIESTLHDPQSATPSPAFSYTSRIGTAYYMAPELFRSTEFETYNEQIDIFSFGMVLAEIILRVSADPDTMPRTYVKMGSDYVFGVDEPQFRKLVSSSEAAPDPALLSILFDCVSLDPARRPTFTALTKAFRMLLRVSAT